MATPATQQTSTLGQRAEERIEKESEWQKYNSETEFSNKSMYQCFIDLSVTTFPNDTVNAIAYAEAIIKSLTENLSTEIGIKDFWNAMEKAGCKTLRIEEGHLNFYDDASKKIDITEFTTPIIYDIHTDFYKQRLMERSERILEAQRQLQELLAEINKQ